MRCALVRSQRSARLPPRTRSAALLGRDAARLNRRSGQGGSHRPCSMGRSMSDDDVDHVQLGSTIACVSYIIVPPLCMLTL